MLEIKGSYINGIWDLNDQLEVRDIPNPAKIKQIVGRVELADKEMIQCTFHAANKSTEIWAGISLENRILLAEKLLNKMAKRADEFEKLITLENGKTLKESRGEFKAAIEESCFHIDFIRKNCSEIIGNNEVRYEPIGVVMSITPWNFPLATIMRKMIPALIIGNTVIVKPSEFTPLTAVLLFEIIHEIQFPKGVLNLVISLGSTVGQVLSETNIIKAISFTGSTEIGNKIKNLLGGKDVRFQGEMGGSNAVVLLKDANLENAIPAIINHGFACCGQWCTGTSRVVVETGIYNEVLKRLKSEISKIIYGDGQQAEIDMGPLANKNQFENIKKAIETAEEEGATMICGGMANSIETEIGYYVKPTLFTDVTCKMKLVTKETFGPVLSLMKAADFDHTIELVNANQFGLSTSIFTEDMKLANKFISKVKSGLVHVNLGTGFREYTMPLMGWKNSGMGSPECGRFMMDLFSKPKVIYRK